MGTTNLDELISQIENYLECWKQFNQFLALSRGKKFGQDDESQFLELKAVLAQQLEIILQAFQEPPLNREEVIQLVTGVPSLRFLGEQSEGVHRSLENQWHQIYIKWQTILGTLKVQQQTAPPKKKGFWASLLGGGDKK
ncbi:MAG: hypothetical protein RI897_3401 [Verrucomicrobiota bacterium]|jgi:hypothetical protein